MTELNFDDKILFEDKLEKMLKRPQDQWIKLIYEWVKMDVINFRVFRAFIEYMFEQVLDEAVKLVVTGEGEEEL